MGGNITSLFRFSVLLGLSGLSTGLLAAFELSGNLPAAFTDGPVTLYRESLEERSSVPVISGQMINGRFLLKVDAAPGLFNLQVGETQVDFVADQEQSLQVISASGGNGLRVTGSADQTLFEDYEAVRQESLARLVLPVRASIRASRAAGDETAADQLTEREIIGYVEHRRELNDFTLNKLRGSIALYAASLRWDGDYRLDELAEVVRDFSAQHPGLEIARLLEERIARFRATALGAMAPDIAGPSPDGKTVSLAQLRGKFVLVDFWASWCSPCRIENRNYVELYRQHRDQGFEILAVSVDQNGNAWRAAITQDNAKWLHLSDLTGWRTPLAARYNVSALPASFLLDPDGRIIAKDVRGRQLAELLETRLGKN